MITILSGGTGTPKLIQGFLEIMDEEELTVIVNTAEDHWLPHGYFSPDIDTVLYTIKGLVDDETWHGIRGDTFITHEGLREMGFDEYLMIGDADRATHIQRGQMMRGGKTLSEVVARQAEALGIRTRVLPMTDDSVQTVIHTSDGDMDLHEFLVKNKGVPDVVDVTVSGLDEAEPAPGVVEAIQDAEKIILGPSNPVTSISPIIGIEGINEAMRARKKDSIGVSPIVGSTPVSGPADRFMKAWGLEATSAGAAGLYRDIISAFVVDLLEDDSVVADIGSMGITCLKFNTIMKTIEDKKALARFIFDRI